MNDPSEPGPDNQIWIDAIYEQDGNALTELWAILSNFLYSQEFPTDIIEDATQLGIMRVVDNIDSFKGNSKFTSWAISIVRNEALQILRKQASVTSSYADSEYISVYDDHSELDAMFAMQDIAIAIENGILNERDWHVFIMYSLEDYSAKETAEEFDLSTSNVYTICHRVKGILQTL